MRSLVLTIIILFSGYKLIAQNLDSLWNIWQDETQPDTTRLKAIQNFTWNGYLFTQPDSAFFFAQIQYNYAKSKGLKKQMAGALNIQGVSFINRGDSPQALAFYQKSLTILKELGNKKGIAGLLNNIGLVYQNQGDNTRALEYYQKSLAIEEELSNKKGIAESLQNLGIIYHSQRNYTQALKYQQKALAMHEELDDKFGIAYSLNNIGINYINQGDYPQALEYFQKSMLLYKELNNKYGIALSLNNIGTFYYKQGKHPQALEYFQKSLVIKEELGNIADNAATLINIGSIYQNRGNYSLALEYCMNALDLAERFGQLSRQKAACQCLYTNYKASGNGNKALEYHEQMLVLDDSLQAEETIKQLERMEFQKQMLADSIAKADEARLVQEAHQEEIYRKNQIRNWTIAGGFLALLLAGGFYSRWRYVRKSRDIISKEKDRSENLLLNILPAEIAEELKEKGRAEARNFEMVSIIFTDFKGFTEQSAKMTAADLVNEINHCFEAFDGIMEKFGIEKIKTIGDAYMAAGGLPVKTNDSVKNTVLAALEMQDFISARIKQQKTKGQPHFEMRLGIHTGPVVAGIVGVKKFQYDIWGDTVNTASRMESSSDLGKVNISRATYDLLKEDPQFKFESRGKVEAKGKGKIEMYFVSKA